MTRRTLGYLVAMFLLATACSNSEFYEAMQAAKSWNRSSSKAEKVSGYWHEENSAEGYDAYVIVEKGGDGYVCNQDGKSQASFSITLKGSSQATMGSYGYGGGDELSVDSSGTKLTRTGTDKGETYTVEYMRVEAVPDWCQAQIDEMTQ